MAIDQTLKQMFILIGTLAMALYLAFAIGGCDISRATSDIGGAYHFSQAGHTAHMDGEGKISATSGTLPITQGMQDDGGAWYTTPGIGAIVTFNQSAGVATVWSPRDGSMTGVEFTPKPEPGSPMLKIADFQFNVSDVVTSYNDQVAATIDATKLMSQEQAKVWIENAKTIGEIAPAVAEMLLKSFVPTLPTGP